MIAFNPKFEVSFASNHSIVYPGIVVKLLEVSDVPLNIIAVANANQIDYIRSNNDKGNRGRKPR